MKKICLILSIVLLFSSCKKEAETKSVAIIDQIDLLIGEWELTHYEFEYIKKDTINIIDTVFNFEDDINLNFINSKVVEISIEDSLAENGSIELRHTMMILNNNDLIKGVYEKVTISQDNLTLIETKFDRVQRIYFDRL